MTQENHSSKREDKDKKELQKQVENLKKIIELQNNTVEHDRRFGKYEMM